MARETIYQALFNTLIAATGIKKSSRRFKMWTEVDKADQPFLCTMQKTEQAIYLRGIPHKWASEVDVFIYTNAGNDSDAILATPLNTFIDAVENAMKPPLGSEVQSLGGVVEHAEINGAIEMFEGVLGDQSVAIIPIKLLWTAMSN